MENSIGTYNKNSHHLWILEMVACQISRGVRRVAHYHHCCLSYMMM